MANDRIDELFDEAAILKHLNSILDLSVAQLQKFPKIKMEVEGAKSVKEYSLATVKMAEEIKAVESLVKQRFATDAKVAALLIKNGEATNAYSKATAASRVELQKQNAELKANAAAEAAALGSRQRATAQIKVLTLQKDKLNLANAEEAKQYEVLVSKIEKYNAFLVKTGTTREKQAANVGNYQGSAKIIVDALEQERKKLEQLKTARESLNKTPVTPPSGKGGSSVSVMGGSSFSVSTTDTAGLAKLDAQIEETEAKFNALQRVTSSPQFLNVAGKVGDATAEVKFFTKALIDLERQGQGNSKAAIDLRKNIAQLTDDIGDAKAEVRALSSDTRGFDLFAGSVTFAADAMQTAAGAAALFGASEEEVQETIKKVVAIQSIANGVKGIANELTTRGTAANKLFAFSQAQLATVFNTSATAANRFKAALITTGFGALIVGIGLIIANFDKLKAMFSQVTREQKLFTEVNKVAAESAGKEVSSLKVLRSAIQDVAVPMKTRLQAVKDLRDQYPAYFKGLTNEEILTGKVGNAYDMAAQAIMRKARANAAAAEIEKLSSQRLQIELDSQLKAIETNNKIIKATADAQVSSGGTAGGGGNFGGASKAAKQKALRDAFNDQKAADEREAAELDKKIQILLKITNAGAVETIEIEKEKEKKISKIKDDSLQILERNLKAAFQMEKDSADERAALFLRDAENEQLPLRSRLNALLDYNNEKQGILIAQKDFDLSNEKLTATEKMAIINKFGIDSNAQIQSFEDTRLRIVKDAKQEELEAYRKFFEDLQKAEEKKFSTSQFKSEQSRNAELLQLQKDYGVGKIAGAEELERQEKSINDKYDKIALDAEVKHQLALLVIRKSAGFDVDAQLKALQGLKDQADKTEIASAGATSQTLIDGEKATADAILEIKKERAEREQQLIQDVQDTLFEFIDSGYEKELASLEERKTLLDLDTQRRINDINLLGLTEVERVRRTAEVERGALFQTEQIEKRKIQLAKDRRKIEKLADAAQVIGESVRNVFELQAKAAQARANAALLASNPATAAFAPAALAAAAGISAQIPFVLAGAALSLARIAAFKKGKDKNNKYEGMALVGDGGKREPILRADGRLELSPATNTLTYLAKNDMVFPDISSLLKNMQSGQIKPAQVNVNNTTDPELKSQIKELISVTKKSKTNVQVHNHTAVETTANYLYHIKY